MNQAAPLTRAAAIALSQKQPYAGILRDLPAEQYHASEGESASTIARYARMTPAAARYAELNDERTPALDLGSFTHTAILEPDYIESRYVVIDKPDLRTKVGRAALAEAQEAAAADGKEIAYTADCERVMGMRDAVHAHPAAQAVLKQGKAELSLYAWDDEQELLLRSREDWQPALNAPLIVDLKTTGKSAAPEQFAKHAIDYGYHIAAWHYRRVRELVTGEVADYCWIVVETKPPYQVAVHYAEHDILTWGEHQWREAVQILTQCRETNVYPDTTTTQHR